MIIASLANIHHHTQPQNFFSCNENFLDLFSKQLTNVPYSIIS